MPRIADPSVPRIINVRNHDLIPIDRPSDHTASNISVEDLGNFLLDKLDLDYVTSNTTINNYALSANIKLTSADVSADTKGTAQLLLNAHVSAPDPHPQYLTVSEAASAGNYVVSVNGHIGIVTLNSYDVSAEPQIPLGTSTQYYRGDKVLADFNSAVSAIASNTKSESVSSIGTLIATSTHSIPTALDSIPFSDSESSNVLKHISYSEFRNNIMSGSISASDLVIGGDTNLYRSAAHTLKTDDALIVNGGLTVVGTMTTDKTVLNGYNLTTISTTPNQILMFAPASIYRTMELTIQGINDADQKFHTSKMLIMSNGVSVVHTEYGSINIGGVVCTFAVDMDAGNMRVLVTPVSANSTSFSVTALLTKI